MILKSGICLQIRRKIILFIIFQYQGGMGNKQLTNSQYHQDKNMIEELCMLTQRDFNQAYRLSFDPFSPSPIFQKAFVLQNFSISSPIEENEDTQALIPIPDIKADQESNQMEIQKQVHFKGSQTYKSLQKNQKSKNTTLKTKKIKKEIQQKKINTKVKQKIIDDQDDCNGDGIRDQNNCKSYHKLVKKYLIQNKLQQKIKEYEDKYHTRYYFLIALLLIKYNLTKDFYPIYSKIVQDEVEFQNGKIKRKQLQINRLNQRIKQQKQKTQEFSKLIDKKTKLENQISHIKVVISEIQVYSKKCCSAFFKNETENALRILYIKNDPVMRKKYYFDTAIKIINDLQNKMRDEVSHG